MRNVLVMCSYFEKQTQGMAFTVGKDHFARTACFHHAEKTLAAWLQGQERVYSVRFVVQELRALFHAGANQSVSLIEAALRVDPDDDETRLRLVTKALDLIGQQVQAEGNTILRPGGKL